MAESPILAIPQIEANQNNKHITANDAVSLLEGSVNADVVNAAVGAGPWTLTEAQFVENFTFEASGASGAYNIVIPDTVNGNTIDRIFCVVNADTADAATVKCSTGATVVIPAGTAAILRKKGTDILQITSLITLAVYDVGFFIPGQPDDAAVVFKLVATRAFSLADDFAGSRCHVGTNPGSTAVFDVLKNGSSIGSISINTSGVATFSTTGGAAETFAAGDRLSVTAPTPKDGNLADISVVFAGTRTI